MKLVGLRWQVAFILIAALVALLAPTVVVSASDQCDAKTSQCAPEARASERAQDGIDKNAQVHAQYLFSTPLLRTHISAFVSNVTAFNAALSKAVIDDYNDFLESNSAAKPEDRNDDFFVYQQGLDGMMTQDELEMVIARAEKMRFRNTPEFATLKTAVSALARHAVRDVLLKRVAGEEHLHQYNHGDSNGDEPIEINTFTAWAAVHYKRARHAMHFHENSALSAVYYVSVPDGSGELTLYDPRGPRPPFEQMFTLYPKEGDLIMFPGWLGHSVGQTGDTGRIPRISIPFNSEGTWEQSSNVPPAEWSVPVAGFEAEEIGKESITE